MIAEAEAVDTSSNVACRRCLPYLKFVRGTGWERKHWTQLFAMLKLVTKVGHPSGDPTCVMVSRHERCMHSMHRIAGDMHAAQATLSCTPCNC